MQIGNQPEQSIKSIFDVNYFQLRLKNALLNQQTSPFIICNEVIGFFLVLQKGIVYIDGDNRIKLDNWQQVKQYAESLLKQRVHSRQAEKMIAQKFSFQSFPCSNICPREEMSLRGGGCGVSGMQKVQVPQNQNQQKNASQSSVAKTPQDKFFEQCQQIEKARSEIVKNEQTFRIKSQLLQISSTLDEYGEKLLIPNLGKFRQNIWFLAQTFKDYCLLRIKLKFSPKLPQLKTDEKQAKTKAISTKLQKFITLLRTNSKTQPSLDLIQEFESCLGIKSVKKESFSEEEINFLLLLHKDLSEAFIQAESWKEDTKVNSTLRRQLKKLDVQISQIYSSNALIDFLLMRMKYWKLYVEAVELRQQKTPSIKMLTSGAVTLRSLISEATEEGWLESDIRPAEILIKFSYEIPQMQREELKEITIFIQEVLESTRIEKSSQPGAANATSKSAVSRCIEAFWVKSKIIRFVILRIFSELFTLLTETKQNNNEQFESLCVFLFDNYRKETEEDIKVVISSNSPLLQLIFKNLNNPSLDEWILQDNKKIKTNSIDKLLDTLEKKANLLIATVDTLIPKYLSSFLDSRFIHVQGENFLQNSDSVGSKSLDIVLQKLFIQDNIVNFLVLGSDRGQGKTVLLKLLMKNLSQRDQQKTAVIYLKQKYLSYEAPSIEKILSCNPYNQNPEQIDNFKNSEQQKLIIIDGFHQLSSRTYTISQLAKSLASWKNTKCIITTRERSEALNRVLWEIVINDTCSFSVYELQNKLICKEENQEEEIHEPMNETEKMALALAQLRKQNGYFRTYQLLSIPANLFMLNYLIQNLENSDQISRVVQSIQKEIQLLQEYAKAAILNASPPQQNQEANLEIKNKKEEKEPADLQQQVEQKKKQNQVELCEKYLEDAAFNIFKYPESTEYDDYSMDVTQIDQTDEVKAASEIALKAGILRQFSNEEFFFASKKVSCYFGISVLFEYFLAGSLSRKFRENIQEGDLKKLSEKDLIAFPISQVSLYSTDNPTSVQANAIQMLHDCWFTHEQFPNDMLTKRAIEFIQRAKRNKDTLASSPLQQGASNIVSALFLSKRNLSFIDLSGLSLQSAYLVNSKLFEAQLKNTQLESRNILASSPALMYATVRQPYEYQRLTDMRYIQEINSKDLYTFSGLFYFSPDNSIFALSQGSLSKFTMDSSLEGSKNLHYNREKSISLHLDYRQLSSLQGNNDFIYFQGYKQIYKVNPVSLDFCCFEIEECEKICFSDDNKFLLTTNEENLSYYSVDGMDLRLEKTIELDNAIISLNFLPDSHRFIIGFYFSSESAKTIGVYEITKQGIKDLCSIQNGTVQNILAISPDGTKIVSQGQVDLSIYQISSNGTSVMIEFLKTIPVHTENVFSSTFSADGKYLLNTSHDSKMSICDVYNDFKVVDLLPFNATQQFQAIFLDDSSLIASFIGSTNNGDHSITITHKNKDQKNWETIQTIDASYFSANALAYSSDSKYLASACPDKTVKIWQPDLSSFSPLKILSGHKKAVIAVDFSRSGRYLASGSNDFTVIIWDAADNFERKPGSMLQFEDAVVCVTFSPDEKFLASGSWDNTFKIWNVQEKRIEQLGHKQEDTHDHAVLALAFNPKSTLLASGSADSTIKIWDVQKKFILLSSILKHKGWIYSLVFSLDDVYLLSGSKDKSLRIWKQEGKGKYEPFKKIEDFSDSVITLAVSPDALHFFSGSRDGTVRVYSFSDLRKKSLDSLNLSTHNSSVNAFAFSRDCRYFATGSKNEMNIWSVNQANLIPSAISQGQDVIFSLFSADNLLITLDSTALKLWDAQNHFQLVSTTKISQDFYFSNLTCLEVSYEPRFLITVTRNESKFQQCQLWNLRTGLELFCTIDTLKDNCYEISFSPKGDAFVLLFTDKSIQLYCLAGNTFNLQCTYNSESYSDPAGFISIEQYISYFPYSKMKNEFPFMININIPIISTPEYGYDFPSMMRPAIFSPHSDYLFVKVDNKCALVDISKDLKVNHPPIPSKEGEDRTYSLFRSFSPQHISSTEDQERQFIEMCKEVAKPFNESYSNMFPMMSFDGVNIVLFEQRNAYIWNSVPTRKFDSSKTIISYADYIL